MAGARELTLDVLKEWWYYFFSAPSAAAARVLPLRHRPGGDYDDRRELLNLLGLNIEWIAGPVSNCYMKGNHLGLEPHTIIGNLEYMLDDIETITGKRSSRPSPKRRRDPVRDAVGRPVCRSRNLYVHGIPHAV